MDDTLLKKLVNAHGVSGHEEPVRKIILNEIKKYVDKVSIDKLGNLIAIKNGIKPSLMLAAHMDEVGLMVKSINNDGKLFLSFLGAIEPIMVVGQTVQIHAKSLLNGIISTDDISAATELKKLPDQEDLFIDTGLTKKELLKKGVHPGNIVTLLEDSSFQYLGSKDIISGKALDDRIGCYILCDLAKRLRHSKAQIYFVFTVQEEVGLYGSRTSAYQLDPDWAIALDVTDADDFQTEQSKKLGLGPTITVKDSDLISNPCINNWLAEIAEKKKIPIQYDVSDAGTTDALSISISKGGVPSTAVGVPVRNLHTTIGIAHKKDIENAIRLLEALLKKAPLKCVV